MSELDYLFQELQEALDNGNSSKAYHWITEISKDFNITATQVKDLFLQWVQVEKA